MSEENVALCDRRFICISESVKYGVKQGLCGDIHTLKDWVSLLFGEEGHVSFAGANEKEMLDYIQTYTGKRLERKKNDKD